MFDFDELDRVEPEQGGDKHETSGAAMDFDELDRLEADRCGEAGHDAVPASPSKIANSDTHGKPDASSPELEPASLPGARDYNPYRILGLQPDATDAEIKSTFRKRSLRVHPDQNSDLDASERFRELVAAKEFLLDPLKRLFYNLLHGHLQQARAQWWSDWDEMIEELEAEPDATSCVPRSLAEARTDILVFGATGLAGALCCQLLQRQAGSSRTWAIAGRNRERLEHVAQKLGTGQRFRGATRVQGNSVGELERLVRTARVVVDMSGPKWRVGSNVAEACVLAGTHYVDNTMFPGDMLNARRTRDLLDERAKAANVALVFFCGYPTQADLATWLLVRHLRRTYQLPTRRVDGYEYAMGFMLSGTSYEAFVGPDNFDTEMARYGAPFLLGGSRPNSQKCEEKVNEDLSLDPLSGAWVDLFPYPDRVAVRCSCGLLDDLEAYGRRFEYKNWVLLGDKPSAEMFKMQNMFLRRTYKKAVAAKKLPSPGQGPKERVRRECLIRRVFVGETDGGGGHKAHCVMNAGPGGMGEPYECTAVTALETAFCLLDAEDKGDDDTLRFGFGTPAYHVAHLGILERLVARGLSYTIHEGAPPRELFQNIMSSTLFLEGGS